MFHSNPASFVSVASASNGAMASSSAIRHQDVPHFHIKGSQLISMYDSRCYPRCWSVEPSQNSLLANADSNYVVATDRVTFPNQEVVKRLLGIGGSTILPRGDQFGISFVVTRKPILFFDDQSHGNRIPVCL